MVDIGTGPPVVLIPGIQGRLEWMRPTVDALAQGCRLLTYSLAGDPGSGLAFDEARGFDALVDQVDAARRQAGVERLAVCGISFGGFVALEYARRQAAHVSALVLVSTPPPRWRPAGLRASYARWPRALSPLFVAGAPYRLGPEILAALPGWRNRLRFVAGHAARVVAAPMSPTLMGRRARLAMTADFTAACDRVVAPTLVVTGEPSLDRVVSVEATREYARRIRGAQLVILKRTGHMGLVTRPGRFAEIVGEFVRAHAEGPEARLGERLAASP